MATNDQLEIIGPGGTIRFYDLNPGKGFANIGSHPDNDIVIASPEVAPFHAVLDHRQRPVQLIVLGKGGATRVGGQPVQPNSARPIANWDTIELDGHSLVLMEGLAGLPQVNTTPALAPVMSPPRGTGSASPAVPAPAPGTLPASAGVTHSVAPAAAAALAHEAQAAESNTIPAAHSLAPVADRADEAIVLEASAREFTLNVDETATMELKIANGGDVVANFQIVVEGIDPAWVVAPASVNLYEGGRQTVTLSISAPRRPSSRAGIHYFGVTVTSPEYPGHLGRIGCSLVLQPYFETAVSELSPRQQRMGWTKRSGQVAYTIINQGNSPSAFRLDANDDERAMQFEFKLAQSEAALAKQAELHLDPQESRTVGVNLTLLTRKFFAFGNRYHSFTITTTPLQGQQAPRALLSQAESSPLIGPIHVVILILLLLALIAWIFRPSISNFAADKPQVMSDEITKGGKVTLSWDSSWFADAKIDQNVGALGRGSGDTQVAPIDSTTYRLTVSTPLLSQIFSAWFSASRELTVEVNPVNPIIRLTLKPERVVIGQGATLSWEILNADEATLSTNGALETVPKEQYISSRSVKPEGQTVFVLEARNHYGTVSSTRTLNAQAPTPTPFPAPVIQRFDALPSPIIAGQEVTLDWSVQNAESVQIDPGGQTFPPVGKISLKPDKTTSYILTALNGPQSARSIRDVIVNPAPTPTPVPGTPVIQFFTSSPTEVALGSPDISNIQLAWAVTGDVTSIEISGETIGKITGLDRQGTQVVSAGSADTQFVLTAYNGTLTASQTVVIKVVVPVPVISSLDPASTTNVGGGGLTMTVSGANFVNGSTVRLNDSDRPTNFVSSTQLTASITAADLAKTGSAKITVFNPADAGGGASGAATFAVNNPVPVMGAVSPNQATVGDSDTVVTVAGSNFVSDSKVRWNGQDLQTTFNSGTQLSAVVTADKLAKGGTASVSVFNPAPQGGTSGSYTFTINNPVPAITTLQPSHIVFQSDAFTLVINGIGFVSGSQVAWAGDRRTAPKVTYVSPTQLTLAVDAADVVNPGPVEVAVINDIPGGGPSTPVNFQVSRAPATVTLRANPASGAVAGQAIIFFADVAPANSTLTAIPGGTVDLFVDGVKVGSKPVTGGVSPVTAQFDLQYFNARTPVITAQYNGDNLNYDPAKSATLNYTVNKADVTVAVAANPSTGPVGSNFVFNVTVAPAGPATNNPAPPSGGSVQLYRNGVPFGSKVAVVNGTASYTALFSDTANQFGGGTWSITASYDGVNDANFKAGSTLGPVALSVTKASPIVTVSSVNTVYGTSPTFVAAVTQPPALAAIPISSAPVTFRDTTSGLTLGTATLNSGTATLSSVGPTTLNAGGHVIVASFDGTSDPNWASADSTGWTHTVARAVTTVTMGSVSQSPSNYGAGATMTATVFSPAGVPVGSSNIVFQVDGVDIPVAASYVGGSATLTLPTPNTYLHGGNNSVTAYYNGGDPNYAVSAASTSVTQSVNRVFPTLSLTGPSGSNTAPVSPATWTATLSYSAGVPTGQVLFTYFSSFSSGKCVNQASYSSTGSRTLSGGQTSFSDSITPQEGGFMIQAIYLGDTNFLPLPVVILTGSASGCT
jgi:hypothetical protein